MLDQTFDEAVHIIDKLNNNGYQAYFVGGCVRDYLINRTISDIDIATSAPPEKVQQLFPNVIPVGLEHGTVIVRHKNKSYEVTTFRVDGKYSDKRRPDNVKFIQTIDDDLKRRDFTINALAMDHSGDIIDLFDGMNDLKHKIIRTVGNGRERFDEDPLRVIRALRFSSQLGFEIDPETINNMKIIAPEISKLAVERVRTEITKFFGGLFIKNGLEYLKRTEIHLYLPVMINYPYIIGNLPSNFIPLKSFSEVVTLFHYLESNIPIKEWLDSWKCSNQEKKEVRHLIKAVNYYKVNGIDNRFLYCLQQKYIDAFMRLITMIDPSSLVTKAELLTIYNSLPIHSRQELQINGQDLITLFPNKDKGPWIKEALNELEDFVVQNHVLNKKTELKDWVKWNPPGTN
ncbi:CCA tRNA nucleotidyltransferase [Virgibacillus sp. DJP39]|uniref:CCA tRNA nucleotidyltransferase n=1 Tax=Virgibacillus sp. DJP39 TaxID=3409790 RepID=UPI003BB6FCDF